MAKIKTSVLFKQNNQQQYLLLPSRLDELISPTHLVRVVNTVVDKMDISGLINLYKGGGASAFHPRMLLKVLLYGYSMKIYTGRKIAQAIRQDIPFMWLAGGDRPDFRTINLFRSSKAKEVIEVLFKELLEFLLEHGYIKMENYFCDGSTFRADANQHKMVWKKNAERYKGKTEQKCRELFRQIEQLNAAEDSQYGTQDLEQEGGAATTITAEAIKEQVEVLNEKLAATTSKGSRRKAIGLQKKLQAAHGKLNKYESQIHTAGKRSGYNKTDADASAMMMKNKVEVLPAYNVLAGSEEQFITGVSVHQNTNDGICFCDHLEEVSRQQPFKPDQIIADSIFGTEQNYELLEQQQIESYLKFPTYHTEQKSNVRNNRFHRDNFPYDPLTDSYECPNGLRLTYRRTYEKAHKRTSYISTIKLYECTDCSGCPFYQQCCKSEEGNNKTIHVNEKLENYKQQARENLSTEKGTRLKKQRSVEIESCFGDIKHNMGFRRFYLRGLKKVKTEITLVAMAHNIRKIYLKGLKKAA